MIGVGTNEIAAIADATEVAVGATRVQLFPYGTWTGRNGLGPYTIPDKAHAERVIAATAAAQGPVDLMFDYDHQAVRAPSVAGRAVASGWITALHAEDDGLWADVDWTPAAAAAIAAREYRYTSPYFLHDKKTGAVTRIINAGLTNTPNFNLAAVIASALTGEDANMNEFLMAIAKALGLADDATQEQVMAEIARLMSTSTAIASATTALGIDAASDGAAIASAIAGLKSKAVDPSQFVPAAEVAALNARLLAVEGDRHAEAVASAIETGRLMPALKDWALDPKNRAAAASFIDKAPVILAPGASTTKPVNLDAVTLTDEDKAVASMMGWSEADMLAQRKIEQGGR